MANAHPNNAAGKIMIASYALGIRPIGYHQKVARKFKSTQVNYAKLAGDEIKFLRGKLRDGFLKVLREKGAPKGTEVTFDFSKLIVDKAYRTRALSGHTGNAAVVSEILNQKLKEIDEAYQAAGREAMKFNKKAKKSQRNV
jgi:hypothetical protein